jgi:phosphatidylglycerol---prolipoprotein diacylglyceryl transferase
MKPYFSLPFLGEFHTNTVLMSVSFFAVLALCLYDFRSHLKWWQTLCTVFVATWLSFIGARLFHVWFERPEIWRNHRELVFAQFDGMTFYGSFIVGGAVLLMFSVIWRLKGDGLKTYWDTIALSMCGTYFLMRLGCFANGCCWGSITASRFAVQYFDPRAVMPALGIPVHPVQLYDAAHGLVLLIVLLIFRLEGWRKGQHAWIVCILYSVGRFATEGFRGDSFRGENVLVGLSTSQVISIAVLMVGIVGLCWPTLRRIKG